MPNRVFKVLRLTDEELFAGLDKVAKAMGSYPNPIRGKFSENQRHIISVPLTEYRTNLDLKKIFEAKSRLLAEVTADFSSAGVIFTIYRRDPFDELHLNFPDEEPEKRVELFTAIAKELHTIDSAAGIERLLGQELTEFYQRREEGLLRLEGLTQKIIEQNEEYRRHIDKELAAEKRKLQEDFDKKETTADTLLREKEAALVQRELQLEERTKQLDDRSSRHARRQIRQDLKTAVSHDAQTFSLSKTTENKRIPIHILFGFLMLGPLFVLVQSFSPPPNQEQLSGSLGWYFILKPLFSGIALAAAVIYYIRWSNLWFTQHATEEFRLKRLNLDIDRASWVVEMALEWKDEKGTEIPHELVERLSRNLFTEEYGETKGPRHPSEDLASALLGASTSLSMKIPGVGDATLDRKGIKNFQKATQE